MSIRLDKPWQPLALAESLPAQLGVYELADAQGQVVRVGYAGPASRFGLRSEVLKAAEAVALARSFRVEVTSAYLTRYRELLMVYRADHGRLPPANEPEPGLGSLSPV